MDAIDRSILRELQRDGRLTITALADRVGLTPSPCLRRLRALEAAGVVRGYTAEVDPAAVGLGFEAIVFVSMRQEDRTTVAAFEERVGAVPEVVEALRLFGDPDFLLRVVAADLPAYQRLYDDELSRLPGVEKLTSTIAMKRLTARRGLPL